MACCSLIEVCQSRTAFRPCCAAHQGCVRMPVNTGPLRFSHCAQRLAVPPRPTGVPELQTAGQRMQKFQGVRFHYGRMAICGASCFQPMASAASHNTSQLQPQRLRSHHHAAHTSATEVRSSLPATSAAAGLFHRQALQTHGAAICMCGLARAHGSHRIYSRQPPLRQATSKGCLYSVRTQVWQTVRSKLFLTVHRS